MELGCGSARRRGGAGAASGAPNWSSRGSGPTRYSAEGGRKGAAATEGSSPSPVVGSSSWEGAAVVLLRESTAPRLAGPHAPHLVDGVPRQCTSGFPALWGAATSLG